MKLSQISYIQDPVSFKKGFGKTVLTLIFIVSILFSGCEQPPVVEMQNAREAVFRAENDPNAVQFASSTLSHARGSLRRMQDEADNKRYDAARSHAADAIAAAERAIAEGRTGSERAGTEADSLILSLRTEIEETSRNVNGARYSQLPLDYNVLDNAIIEAHNTTDLAEADHAAGRYQQALDRARVVRTDLSEINQTVAAATVRVK